MLRIREIIFLLAIILFLPGCNLLTGILGGGNTDIKVPNIHTGSQGLKMSFVENQPMSSYRVTETEGAPIIITLTLENMGTSLLAEDTTITVNTDNNYIVMDNDRANVALQGKTQERPLAGEKTTVTFTGMVQPMKIEDDKSVIDVSACYRYSVEGQFDVCIDTDPANLRTGKKGCSSKDNSISSSGQGGPVGASKIEVVLNEHLNSVSPKFLVHVRNFGKGRVFDAFKSPSALCSSALSDASSINVVFVGAKLAGLEFKCEPNPLVLSDVEENNYVTCSNAGYGVSTDTSSFASSLVVYMVYDYIDSISKEITIKKIKTTN